MMPVPPRPWQNPRVPCLVSAEPTVSVHELTRDDVLVILASDGLWDILRWALRECSRIGRCWVPDRPRCLMLVYSDVEAAKLAFDTIRGHKGPMFGPDRWHPTEMNVREAADALVSTAIRLGTTDNTTAVVMALQWN
jgi:serine/threonine protein phosphatase PrpC